MLEFLNIAATNFVGHRTLAYLLIPHLTTLHPENLRKTRVPRISSSSSSRLQDYAHCKPCRAFQKAKRLRYLALPAPVNINLLGRFNQRLDGLAGEFRHLKPHLAKHDEYIQVFFPRENFRSGRQTGHHCHILGHPLVPSTRGQLPGGCKLVFGSATRGTR